MFTPFDTAIGAGIGAILPVVMELMRDKPDPEVAKKAILAKRQEMIDYEIGGGKSKVRAEKDVDAQIAKEVAAAEKAGEFNTPWGEMVLGAAMGAVTPAAFAKVGSLLKGGKAAADVAAKGATTAAAGAAEGAATTAAGAAKEVAKTAAKRAPRSVSRPFPGAVTAKELDPLVARSEALGRMQPSAMAQHAARRRIEGVASPYAEGITAPYPEF